MNNRSKTESSEFLDAIIVGNTDYVNAYLNEHSSHLEKMNCRTSYYLHSALHRAIIFDFPSILEALLIAGADVNAQDKEGNTPLMLAVMYRRYDHIRLLLAATDVNIDIQNDRQQTVLDMLATFKEFQNRGIYQKAIYDYFDYSDNELFIAGIQLKNNITIRRHIRLHTARKLNYQNALGCTALQLAAGLHQPGNVKLLMNAGVDINLADTIGITPLIAATAANDIYTVRVLLGSSNIDLLKTTHHTNMNAWQIAVSKGYTNIADAIEVMAITRRIPLHTFPDPHRDIIPQPIPAPTIAAPEALSQPKVSRRACLFAPTTEEMNNAIQQAKADGAVHYKH